MLNIKSYSRSLPLVRDFRISRGAKTHADVIVVEIDVQGFRGRGEAVPYPRYGGSVEKSLELLKAMGGDLNRRDLRENLDVAARAALDAAILDIRAKITHTTVWKIKGVEEPKAVRTAQTLSLGSAQDMAKQAEQLADDALIKMKLGGEDDIEAVKSVRKVRPQAQIIVDANEGWNLDDYRKIIPELVKAKVEMIEQPFKAGDDGALRELERPIKLCADESVHMKEDLPNLIGLYDMVNIKLDKTGGLSEALKFKAMALMHGFEIMVGCMVGSSLSMAPAQLLCAGASYVDLDGPLWLAEDIEHGIEYRDGIMYPARRELWG